MHNIYENSCWFVKYLDSLAILIKSIWYAPILHKIAPTLLTNQFKSLYYTYINIIPILYVFMNFKSWPISSYILKIGWLIVLYVIRMSSLRAVLINTLGTLQYNLMRSLPGYLLNFLFGTRNQEEFSWFCALCTGWEPYKEECGGCWTTNVCSRQYNGITGLQRRFPVHTNELLD